MGRTLIKNGYLRVKTSSKFKGFKVKAWKKRWIVIWHEDRPTRQLSVCTFKTEAAADREISPTLEMPTATSIEVSWIKSKSQRFAFRVAQGDSQICLAAESQKEADDWLSAIRSDVKVTGKYEAACTILNGNGAAIDTHRLVIEGQECQVCCSQDGTTLHAFHGAEISSVRFTNSSNTTVDITLIIERHGQSENLRLQCSADGDLYEQLRKLQVACLPESQEGDPCNTWPKKRTSKRNSFYDNEESSSSFAINVNSITEETQHQTHFQNLNQSQSMSGYGAIMPGSQMYLETSSSVSCMKNQNGSLPLLDMGICDNEKSNDLWTTERCNSHGNIQKFDQMYYFNFRKMSEQLISEHKAGISHVHSVPSLKKYSVGENLEEPTKLNGTSGQYDRAHNGQLGINGSIRQKQGLSHRKDDQKNQNRELYASEEPPIPPDRPRSLLLPRKSPNDNGVKRSATFRNFFLRKNANRKQSLDSAITLADSTASDPLDKPRKLRSKSFRSYLKPKLVKSSLLSLLDGRETHHREGKYVQRSRSMGNIKSSNQRRLSPRDLVMSSDHDLSARRTSVPIPSNPTRHNSTQLLLETLLDLQHFQPRAPSVGSSRNSGAGASTPADPVNASARNSGEASEDKAEKQEKQESVKVSTDHTGMYYDHLLQYLDQVTEELDQAEITDLEEDDKEAPRLNHFVPYSRHGSKGRLNLKLSASKLAAHEAVYMSMEDPSDLEQPFNKPKKKTSDVYVDKI